MIRDVVEQTIGHATDRIKRRVGEVVRRAIVRLVNDAAAQQELQIEVFELHDGVENFDHYGLTSNPPPGSEAIVVRPGGSTDNQIAIATAYRVSRPKVASGEVTLWDTLGQLVALRLDRIELAPALGNQVHLGAGATAGVAREGDTVDAAALWAAWFSAVGTAIETPPPDDPLGVISSGSSTVKAVG